MPNRRQFVRISVGTSAALLLAACARGGTALPGASDSVPTAAPVASPAAAGSPPNSPAGGSPVAGSTATARGSSPVYQQLYDAHNYATLPIADNPPKYGGTLNIIGGTTNDPTPDFNPLRTPSYAELSTVFDSLLVLDVGRYSKTDPTKRNDARRPTIMPWLAKSWTQETPTVLVLQLQQGVTFFNLPPVNGRELTSQDVKASLDAYRASPGWGAILDSIQQVETPDKYTVRITTSAPHASLLTALSIPLMGMLPTELIDNQDLMKSVCIATGPFMVGDYQPNVSITYVRNPNYWAHDVRYPANKLPYLDAIQVTRILDFNRQVAAFRTRQADSIQVTVPSQLQDILKSNPDTVYQIAPPSPGGCQNFQMRLDQKPFSDIRVRRALSMAIDRQAVWDQAGEGFWGAAGPVAYYEIGLDSPYGLQDLGQWYQYNPVEAKRLLTEAGYPNGFETKIQSWYAGGPPVDGLQVVQSQWKKNLNVDVTISTPGSAAVVAAVASKSWDGIIHNQFSLGTGSSTDVDDFTYGMYHSKSSRNFWGYANPAMDDLTQQERVELDPSKRAAIIKRIFQLELDEVPRIWLAGAWSSFLWQPRVQDASVNAGFWYIPMSGSFGTRWNWLDV